MTWPLKVGCLSIKSGMAIEGRVVLLKSGMAIEGRVPEDFSLCPLSSSDTV